MAMCLPGWKFGRLGMPSSMRPSSRPGPRRARSRPAHRGEDREEFIWDTDETAAEICYEMQTFFRDEEAGTTVRTSAQPAPPELLMVAADDLQARLAWRSARLEFSGTPLIEAVALLNQHNHVQFTIEDPDLARMRVSGIFRAVNTDAFVRLLESSFGIQSERRGADEIVLRRKP